MIFSKDFFIYLIRCSSFIPYKIFLILLFSVACSKNPLGEGTSPGLDCEEQDSIPPTFENTISHDDNANLLESPTFNWSEAADQCGIKSYEYAIGTSAGDDDIVAWLDIGNVTSFKSEALSLINSTNYYFSLRASDHKDNKSAIITSSAWMVGPPTFLLNIASPSANFETQDNISLSIECEVGVSIDISGDLVTAVTGSTCDSSPKDYTLQLSGSDGTKNLTITGQNSTGSKNISTTFIKDTSPPAIAIVSPSENYESQQDISLVLNCELNSQVSITGTGILSPMVNINCNETPKTFLLTLSANEGAKALQIDSTDPAGNSATGLTTTYIRDNTAPQIIKTSGDSPILTNADNYTWTGDCEGNFDIQVTGSETTTINCVAGSWSYTTPNYTTDTPTTFTLTQSDNAGNQSSLPLAANFDKTAPTFTFNQTSPTESNLDQITLSGNCEGNLPIIVTGDSTDNFSCSGGVWSWTSTAQTTDGTYIYNFSTEDPAGNTTNQSFTWNRSSIGPNLNIVTGVETQISNLNTVTFNGDCEPGFTITITGSESTSISCTIGTWIWTSSARTTDGAYSYTFSQTDNFSNTRTASGDWYRKTSLPSVTAFTSSSGVLNGTYYDTTTNFVSVNITVDSNDSNSNIVSFCIKNENTQPSSTADSCFIGLDAPTVSVTPDDQLTITGYNYLLGYVESFYDIYIWTADDAGNISTLTNPPLATFLTDTIKYDYYQGVPPTISNVIAANTDLASIPPDRSQTQVPAGTDVFIKWKVVDDNPLPAGSISISYTEDGNNLTTIATGIEPLQSTGCPSISLAADEGCYKWSNGSPSSNLYKVIVTVADAGNLSSQQQSNDLNLQQIKIIAGNTELGTNTSAKGAMFINTITSTYSNSTQFVILSNGNLLFNDTERGILMVNPQDGIQKVLIPRTGTSSGDGGSVDNATVATVHRVVTDYNDNVYIYDVNVIRKIDLSTNPATISSFIGGGASSADTESPLNISLYNYGNSGNISTDARRANLFFTPNGDFYFHSERAYKSISTPTYRIRKYNSATGMVESIYFNNQSLANIRPPYLATSRNVNDCEFRHPGFEFDINSSALTYAEMLIRGYTGWANCLRDDTLLNRDAYGRVVYDLNTMLPSPATGKGITDFLYWVYFHYTGMDGKLYHLIDNRYIARRNQDSTYTRILGSGTRGRCEDGTQATSCNMNLRSFFMTSNGTMYFLDDGLLRTVEANGNVRTLYGQRPNFGDGVNALNARFAGLNYIGKAKDGAIITSSGYFFKEFSKNGDINLLIGNGSNQNSAPVGIDPKNAGVYDNSYYTVDSDTGDIYYRGNSERIYRLNRTTGLNERVLGCGTESYLSADGLLGGDISCNNQNYVLPMGFHNGRLLASRYRTNNVTGNVDSLLKFYDKNDSFRQSHFAGLADDTVDYYRICDSGDSTATCEIPMGYYFNELKYDSTSDRWYLFRTYNNGTYRRQIYSMQENGTVILEATTSAQASGGHAVRRNLANDLIVGFCATDGKIHEYNLTQSSESALPWPNPDILCKGRSFLFDPTAGTNGSYIFPFIRNNLEGVAEYYVD